MDVFFAAFDYNQNQFFFWTSCGVLQLVALIWYVFTKNNAQTELVATLILALAFGWMTVARDYSPYGANVSGGIRLLSLMAMAYFLGLCALLIWRAWRKPDFATWVQRLLLIPIVYLCYPTIAINTYVFWFSNADLGTYADQQRVIDTANFHTWRNLDDISFGFISAFDIAQLSNLSPLEIAPRVLLVIDAGGGIIIASIIAGLIGRSPWRLRRDYTEIEVAP